jgi:hypothetical protein
MQLAGRFGFGPVGLPPSVPLPLLLPLLEVCIAPESISSPPCTVLGASPQPRRPAVVRRKRAEEVRIDSEDSAHQAPYVA